MAPKKILVFEPYAAGHRLIFVRYLMAELAKRAELRVILAVAQTELEHPMVRGLLTDYGHVLDLEIFDPGPPRSLIEKAGRFGRQFQFTRWIRSRVIRGDVDAVFVPFLDDYALLPLALSRGGFGVPCVGVAIRPLFHLRQAGAVLRWKWTHPLERIVYRLLLSRQHVTQLFTIDPFLAGCTGSSKVVGVPDPSDFGSVPAGGSPRQPLGIAEYSVVILVYGYIDHRKGLDRLIAALVALPESVVVVVAGVQDASVAALMGGDLVRAHAASGRIVQINRVITDQEERDLFQLSDIVWNFYPGNYGPSGVLVRAGQAGRPVIATREGFVGLVVRDAGMGSVASEGDDVALADALMELCADASLRRRMGEAGQRRFRDATPEGFASPIVSALATTLGAN